MKYLFEKNPRATLQHALCPQGLLFALANKEKKVFH